ncbi:MAG TPA: ParB-like protein [Steroidobacteraceae bacterium]|nr:ParB-like protein [Steroidobacteraceae bacterium]
MSFAREPRLHAVALADLRPTQITVGMREVEAKRRSWREHPDFRKADFLGNHLLPVIWGPKEEFYIIDHHHLSLALHREGVKRAAVTVVADLRRLPTEAFWAFIDNRGWLHPFDAEGRRRSYRDVPRRIWKLQDDPYRSLAGELRRAGGFSKDTTPFSEFLWADFLRRRIKRRLIEKDFDAALVKALKLARSGEADFLPGWCGPIA